MTSSNPLVSVVLPTHNRAHLISRAIRSVLAQTYRNLELIVVDDCSSDNTQETVERFEDPRLRYVRLDRNRRAAGARNFGYGLAKGEFLAFQDDDDAWLIRKLERQVAALRADDERVGLNLCDYISIFEDRAVYIGGTEAFRQLDFARGPLLGFGLIATPGWLVRRRCFEEAGLFDERMRSWDDWELGLRLSRICRFSHTNEPLMIQDRIAGGFMWKNEAAFSNDMRIILDKHSAHWAGQPKVLSRQCLMVGKSECLHHSSIEGRRWLLKALRHDPWNLRAWAFLALSWLGTTRAAMLVRVWRERRIA